MTLPARGRAPLPRGQPDSQCQASEAWTGACACEGTCTERGSVFSCHQGRNDQGMGPGPRDLITCCAIHDLSAAAHCIHPWAGDPPALCLPKAEGSACGKCKLGARLHIHMDKQRPTSACLGAGVEGLDSLTTCGHAHAHKPRASGMGWDLRVACPSSRITLTIMGQVGTKAVNQPPHA